MADKNKKYKCYDCPNCVFKKPEDLYLHIEEKHQDCIPNGMSPSQYYFYRRTGKAEGTCVVCKKPTTWNESTHKYNRFCTNPKCKTKYREIFKQRMVGKYGKVCLLDDPNMQRKMLANRSISGKYKWSNGVLIPYVGSYEKNALEFEDLVLNWDSKDIMSPSPHTYYYVYEGKKHFYIPDQYNTVLNAEIEIKDGGDNPNMHPKIQAVDKVKEALKDDVMRSQKGVNYLKLTNNNFNLLLDFIAEIKSIALSDNPNRNVIMIDKQVEYIPRTEGISIDEYRLTEVDKILIESICEACHGLSQEEIKRYIDVDNIEIKEELERRLLK